MLMTAVPIMMVFCLVPLKQYKVFWLILLKQYKTYKTLPSALAREMMIELFWMCIAGWREGPCIHLDPPTVVQYFYVHTLFYSKSTYNATFPVIGPSLLSNLSQF